MKAGIIIIGNEILSGKCQDKNTFFIAKHLNKLGYNLVYQQAVLDDEKQIQTALKNAFNYCDAVICTGGLGPTDDDITVATVASYFNKNLEYNEQVWQHILSFFKKRKITPSETNKKQCLVPHGFELMPNKLGTAPGLHYNFNNKHLFLTPGVPYEMQGIFENSIVGILKASFRTFANYSIDLNTYGIAESKIAEDMQTIKLPKDVNIAWLPHVGRVDIRIYGNNENAINQAKLKLYELFGEYIWGENQKSFAEKLHNIMLSKNLTLGFAESCTGGMVSKLITDFSGSSKYFKGSVVSYSGLIKNSFLNVKKHTLQNYGEVSPQTAEEMALGAKQALNVDIAGSITGIAGPGGGTKTKPVGTVHFAVSCCNKIFLDKRIFTGNRDIVRKKSANKILYMILKAIENLD